jgi:hypothetical protein
MRYALHLFSVALLIVAGVSSAAAQDWARAMFKTLSHDFGVVARGAKVEYRFVFENIYEEDLHVESVTSDCRCSVPHATKQLLKTWEKGEIVVTVDTRAEPGQKDGTIKVVFDRPFRAEVQLHVHTFIRGDVVVQPGAVEFGSVDQGVGAAKELKISYAGRGDWRIERVECANPSIEAKAVEIARSAGRIDYRLLVKLKSDAPPGYLREQVVLVTNDSNPRSARVPVPIEGVITAALTARPAPLMMGLAEPGKPLTRNLVIQGRVPFRVLSANSTDERFRCEPPADSKAVQVLPVTFLAPENTTAGRLTAKIRVETDLAGAAPLEVEASVQVVPLTTAKP